MTSAESLAAAAAAVSEQTGGRLDYLVNNPGLQFVGPLLDFDLRRARDMYEVNVLGAVAAVKAFAPLIIAAKGTVVNIASIAGLMYPPYMGMYYSSFLPTYTLPLPPSPSCFSLPRSPLFSTS